jgi:hypothetical protein
MQLRRRHETNEEIEKNLPSFYFCINVASRSLVGGDSENVQITKRTFVSNYKP